MMPLASDCASKQRLRVCDAGGILAMAGVLEGSVNTAVEVLALDWTAMTVGGVARRAA
jgi:hypothetical protein